MLELEARVDALNELLKEIERDLDRRVDAISQRVEALEAKGRPAEDRADCVVVYSDGSIGPACTESRARGITNYHPGSRVMRLVPVEHE